jgi:hypothetical protein
VITLRTTRLGGRDSSVGIVTRYGLDGPVIESRWVARFSTPVPTGPGTYPVSYTRYWISFPGVKRQGRGVDHPPPSNAEVKETVEIYLYTPSGPSWSVLRRTLPLPLPPGLTFKNSTWCSHCVYIFSMDVTTNGDFLVWHNISRLVLYNASGEFTARCTLSPYIKQTLLVFGGLSHGTDVVLYVE